MLQAGAVALLFAWIALIIHHMATEGRRGQRWGRR